MAVTDEVVQLVRASRDRTVELTDQQVVRLALAWTQAWDELEPEFSDALAFIITDGGEDIPASVVARDRRLAQALAAARSRVDELADFTASTVSNDVGDVVLDAAEAHFAALQAQLPDGAPGVTLGTLDAEALEAIVARTTQQIASSVDQLPPAVDAAMRAELVRGITVGDNPNTVAQRILKRTEGAFNGGLARAARISRTEMLDAHRVADLESAKANSNVIKSNIWVATFDSRTCGSCLAQHGTEWPVDAFGPEDHQQGRCVFVPRTKTWAELGFVGIEDSEPDRAAQRDDWWNNLTKRSQDSTLGRAKADLLRSGEISWDDLIKRVINGEWRNSYVETPLKDLLP